jgi:hypothetical protein
MIRPGGRPRMLVAVAVAALAAGLAVAGNRAAWQVDMLRNLPADGVVASDVGAPGTGAGWLVTSGTLLSRGGRLWSGRPDRGPPDPAHGRTGSAVLRAVTVRRDFRDVRVRLDMQLTALDHTARTGERAWDGVHVFLRYRSEDDLYAVDLVRRDGLLTIKRKVPDRGGGGRYTLLASAQLAPSSGWRSFDLTVRNVGAAVDVALALEGQVLLHAVDYRRSAQLAPGAVGIRGDNADFVIRRLVISPIG